MLKIALLLVGVALLVAGVAMVYIPAAFIVGGLVLVTVFVVVDLANTDDRDRDSEEQPTS